MLRKPSGSLFTPTSQQVDAGRVILGIPLQRSCLMHQVVFLAPLRRSPPPTASPLLNWVRPYKCGGYKVETPSLPCAARLAAENADSPQDGNLLHPSQPPRRTSSYQRSQVSLSTHFSSARDLMYGRTCQRLQKIHSVCT